MSTISFQYMPFIRFGICLDLTAVHHSSTRELNMMNMMMIMMENLREHRKEKNRRNREVKGSSSSTEFYKPKLSYTSGFINKNKWLPINF